VNQDTATHIAVQALTLTMKVSMPFLLAGLVVGVAISIFQAVTQIQEQTLSFIPKILVTAAVVALAGPWMLDQMVGYTHDLFTSIPSYAAGP
jgi:flagellar biosynthetic protein FliQ